MLEPITPDEVKANQEAYERVVAEIERGLRLVTGQPTMRSEKLGWVGLVCEDEEMALWQSTVGRKLAFLHNAGIEVVLPVSS